MDPKTLNGLITEYMEIIPETGTSLLLDNHPVDIVQIKDNMVKTVRIHRPLEHRTAHDHAGTRQNETPVQPGCH